MTRVKASDIVIHIIGWLIFLSLPLLFITGQPEDKSILTVLSSLYFWLFFLFYISVFYINTYLLIPRLYLKKRHLAYIAVVLLLLAAVWLLKPFDHLVARNFLPRQTEQPERRPPPPGEMRPPPEDRPFMGDDRPPPANNMRGGRGQFRMERRVDVVSIFLFFMVLALSMAVQVTHRWRVTEQRAARAEADKAHAELSFLKAQINPHFLFNTLNNIYSLAITHNEHTAASIMKLSNIMRYVSDDVLQNFVPLQHEMDCIRDYIDLQRLRLGKKTRVDLGMSGNPDNLQIAPLLLMTFVENAFKYGTSNHDDSLISIRLKAEENAIRFSCTNRIFASRRLNERTGIGIANTRQRLDHLYPGKYDLSIANGEGFFNVQLVLQV
ncbi:MAG TPA: sensor histidine kinase [Chitinophagaceae bacterium]|nr:sensor histidine kinase [Chitinophagaceae bacterium]